MTQACGLPTSSGLRWHRLLEGLKHFTEQALCKPWSWKGVMLKGITPKISEIRRNEGGCLQYVKTRLFERF